jgi:hypothetical protein
MSKRKLGTPRHRPLRWWRVRITCHIEPHVESESIERYSERVYAEMEQDVTVDVEAYTGNAARDRVARALQSLVDKEHLREVLRRHR